MDILSDREIRLAPGETVTATSDHATLSISGIDRDHGNVIEISSPTKRRVTLQAHSSSKEPGRLTFESSLGGQFKAVTLPGLNQFFVIIEPRPDDSYCSNDYRHPVSKTDALCETCGFPVIHGGQ